MPIIDVVDSTWFAARPAAVAAVVAEPGNWRRWWPGLALTVDEWRGEKGVRWSVPSATGRAAGLSGSAEVWLEPMAEGVVGHFFSGSIHRSGRGSRAAGPSESPATTGSAPSGPSGRWPTNSDPGRAARAVQAEFPVVEASRALGQPLHRASS